MTKNSEYEKKRKNEWQKQQIRKTRNDKSHGMTKTTNDKNKEWQKERELLRFEVGKLGVFFRFVQAK